MRVRAAIISLAAAAIALPAEAQSAKQPEAKSAAGAWSFVTGEMSDTCIVSGDMTITPKPGSAGRAFACSFKAVQSRRIGVLRSIHTNQSCVATQNGAQVVISSRLDKVVSVDPQAMFAGMDRRYAPDNFKVTINTLGDQMDGKFEPLGEALVRFRRQQELVS